MPVLDEHSLLERADSRLAAADVEAYRASGAWRGVCLHAYVEEAARERPQAVATVTYDHALRRGRAVTYADYAHEVRAFAAGLATLGVARGDRVAVMLPNRHEFGVAIFGIMRAGACYSGIPSAYGEREALHIVRTVGARVLVVQDRVRGRDLLALAEQLRAACPDLEHVVVVRERPDEGAVPGTGSTAWDDLLAAGAGAAAAHVPGAHAGDVCHIGFTSGTSGAPKGVMNTHQTLDFVLHRWVDYVGRDTLGWHPVNFVPSPVGHHSGFLWGVVLSVALGGTVVHMPRWDPAVAVEIVARERVQMMLAAPTFLQDLLDAGEGRHSDAWRLVAIPGAPIPRELVPHARATLGCFICPSWGMTEWGIGISTRPGDPDGAVDTTDGRAVPGCEVGVFAGAERCEPGVEGALRIRGPGLFVGYLDRPDAMAEAFVDGWFDTGDRAVMDADGYIEIRGRSKDIIIRGGENIPVTELENLLFRHPAVHEVALVGVPDPRLGERACAVVVPARPQGAPSLDELCAFLLDAGVSKHYLPELLSLVEELPKTMSGKIRKEELRRGLAAG